MSDIRREIIMLMEQTRTSQRRLSRLLGKSPMTVNRWFRPGRTDSLDPPFYALNFMRSYIQLSPGQRERMPTAK